MKKTEAALALLRATADVCEERPLGDQSTAFRRAIDALCALGLSREDALLVWDVFTERDLELGLEED